jgi:1,4-dihydroxy-2-naphthoate octaprenyltransferase
MLRPVARAVGLLISFVRLGRPHFLVGGFVVYGLGAALAAFLGATIDWSRYWLGQGAITATQLMTHYANDYFDFAADQANTTPTRFSGGSRVLPGGDLPIAVALIAALVLGALGLGIVAVVARVDRGGALAAGLMVLASVLAWEYSAPPLRLHSRGLGELTTALVVTLLTPLVAFLLQAGHLRLLPFLAVVPLCALQFAMLLAIEFPDAAGDTAVGKRTLVVRLGGARAARLYQLALGAAYLWLPTAVPLGLPIAIAGAILLTAPLAVWLIVQMSRGIWRQPVRWETLAFATVALLIATSIVELAAVLLCASS